MRTSTVFDDYSIIFAFDSLPLRALSNIITMTVGRHFHFVLISISSADMSLPF